MATITRGANVKLLPPTVIFVRPQAAGNMGALARVMSNFGLSELRIVGTPPNPNSGMPDFSTMDWALARCGENVLRHCSFYSSLGDALAGVHLTIGSSGREREHDGGYARPLVSPESALDTVSQWQQHAGLEGSRWAFVIGPEDDGLTQGEGALCQKLLRLPTELDAASMNAAMAAGCFLYQWKLWNQGIRPLTNTPTVDGGPFVQELRSFSQPGRDQWADGVQKEKFLDYVMNTLARTEFLKYPDVEAVRARIRRWLQSAPIPLGELLFAFELVYHLRAWGSGTFEGRDFLSEKK